MNEKRKRKLQNAEDRKLYWKNSVGVSRRKKKKHPSLASVHKAGIFSGNGPDRGAIGLQRAAYLKERNWPETLKRYEEVMTNMESTKEDVFFARRAVIEFYLR